MFGAAAHAREWSGHLRPHHAARRLHRRTVQRDRTGQRWRSVNRIEVVEIRSARQRAARFLAGCQRASGAIGEPSNPLELLKHGGNTSAWFFAAGGADVWHTANALIALGETNRIAAPARRFVARSVLADGSLS